MRQDLKVDTERLLAYAQRLDRVNRRLADLDLRLKGLYHRVGLAGLLDLIQADALTAFSWPMRQCSDYLRLTAEDFERTEKRLLKEDPVDFRGRPSVEELEMNIWKGWWALDKRITQQLTKDVVTLGPVLGWIETQYKAKKKEHFVVALIDGFIDDGIKDAYKVCSGVLQGNLKVDETLEIYSGMLLDAIGKVKHKTAYVKGMVAIEAIRYALKENTAKVDAKAQEKLKEQLREIDLTGSALVSMEAFVDVIGGGFLEIGGSIGGAIIDTCLDKGKKIPYVGSGLVVLDTLCEQRIGMSPGEAFGKLGEIESYCLDKMTDAVVDVLDGVNDTLRAGRMKIYSKLAELIG